MQLISNSTAHIATGSSRMVVLSFHKPFSCLVESKLQPAGHFSDDQWQSSAGEGGEEKYREFIGKKVSL